MIEVAGLSPWLFVVAPLVIVVAYTIFGLSGFGSTIIAVPLLAHFLPVTFLVPLMALLDVAAAALVGHQSREHMSREEMKNLLPFIFVGFIAGATVLVGVPQDWLRAALGVFAAAVGVNSIVNPTLHKRISRLWCVPAGITGGAIASVFGAGGPIYSTYLSGRLDSKDAEIVNDIKKVDDTDRRLNSALRVGTKWAALSASTLRHKVTGELTYDRLDRSHSLWRERPRHRLADRRVARRVRRDDRRAVRRVAARYHARRR